MRFSILVPGRPVRRWPTPACTRGCTRGWVRGRSLRLRRCLASPRIAGILLALPARHHGGILRMDTTRPGHQDNFRADIARDGVWAPPVWRRVPLARREVGAWCGCAHAPVGRACFPRLRATGVRTPRHATSVACPIMRCGAYWVVRTAGNAHLARENAPRSPHTQSSIMHNRRVADLHAPASVLPDCRRRGSPEILA